MKFSCRCRCRCSTCRLVDDLPLLPSSPLAVALSHQLAAKRPPTSFQKLRAWHTPAFSNFPPKPHLTSFLRKPSTVLSTLHPSPGSPQSPYHHLPGVQVLITGPTLDSTVLLPSDCVPKEELRGSADNSWSKWPASYPRYVSIDAPYHHWPPLIHRLPSVIQLTTSPRQNLYDLLGTLSRQSRLPLRPSTNLLSSQAMILSKTQIVLQIHLPRRSTSL